MRLWRHPGTGRYYASWTESRDGQSITRRRALSTADREEAQRRLADAQRRSIRSDAGVVAIMDGYLTDKEGRAVSVPRMREAWVALEPFFGHLLPDQIDRNRCRDYAAMRRRAGCRDGTIGKELSVLRAALRWHDKNTPAVVELPPATPPRDRYITRAELDTLAAAATTPHVRLFILLAWFTAARKEALLTLRWDQIDYQRGLVDLGKGTRTKGRAIVPLARTLRRELESAEEAARTEYVIEWGARPVRSIRKGFAEACRRAGLEDVTPHVLRHSAAVAMAEKGVPISEISQYLGHTSIRVTERVYARYSPAHLRRAAAALE